MKSVKQKFATNLVELRRAAGLTQKDLGEACGWPKAMVSQYECGRMEPGLRNLVAMTKALNCSADDLLGL